MPTSEPVAKRLSVNARKRRALLERDGNRCWICGSKLGQNITLDHVIPRAHGGKNELANLKLAHGRCNRKRGAPLSLGG